MEQTPTRLPWRPALPRKPKGRQANAPCRFFAQGNCRSGQTCSYNHAAAAEVSETTREMATTVESPKSLTVNMEDTRKQIPCRFYVSGNCLKGDSCPFAHVNSSTSVEPRGDEEVQAPDPDEVCDLTCSISLWTGFLTAAP